MNSPRLVGNNSLNLKLWDSERNDIGVFCQGPLTFFASEKEHPWGFSFIQFDHYIASHDLINVIDRMPFPLRVTLCLGTMFWWHSNCAARAAQIVAHLGWWQLPGVTLLWCSSSCITALSVSSAHSAVSPLSGRGLDDGSLLAGSGQLLAERAGEPACFAYLYQLGIGWDYWESLRILWMKLANLKKWYM